MRAIAVNVTPAWVARKTRRDFLRSIRLSRSFPPSILASEHMFARRAQQRGRSSPPAAIAPDGPFVLHDLVKQREETWPRRPARFRKP